MPQYIGKYLILAGIILILAGMIILLCSKFNFLGNLPGDIRIKRDNFTLYAPITTMILISVVLSFLLWLISKIFK